MSSTICLICEIKKPLDHYNTILSLMSRTIILVSCKIYHELIINVKHKICHRYKKIQGFGILKTLDHYTMNE
jgi:hypothetical protein